MHEHLAQRRAHIATAPPGRDAALHLAKMTDEAVRELARAASSALSGRWAVIALGGWGSGQLLPKSDLDLLVLSDAPASQLKPFVEGVLYPLWDAGLEVGHQVRSPKEQQRAMRSDLATRTAALTGRAIAGDTAWAEAQLKAWASDARKRSRRGLTELIERPRPGSPWLLEPDLKYGAGGRRDFDELTWTAATLTGQPTSDPNALVDQGLLTREEWMLLDHAARTVTAARWRLQRDGFGDTLSLEAANDFTDDAETIQAALGLTALLLARVRARRVGSARGATGNPNPAERALTAHEVFAALDRHDEGLAELELAAQAGSLDALLPGMQQLMSVRRPGLGHELTVGAHCLRAASLIGRADDDPALAGSRAATGDLRVVRVAALVHDAGKVEGGAGHAERGAGPAARAARAFGFDTPAQATVAALVRLHLTLVETALREDLDDEDTILRCASRVGDRELVAPLHLLTAADSMATGRATWTPWTASLLTSLVARLDTALSPDVDGAGLAARGEEVRAEALALLGGALDAERAFVEVAPLRYLATREPAEIIRDTQLVSSLLGAGGGAQVRTAVSVGPATGTTSVSVAAFDRPFLLARLAGALSLAGLNILSVDAYRATGGVALDRFIVQSATARPLTPETFSTFERLATAALEDRYELAVRLAERRRHYPARASVKPIVRIEQGGWDTTVRVRIADRPGVLHEIASAMSASGLDIRWARIHTVEGVADDVFHVTGDDGGAVNDPGVLGHLSMRLRELA